jgi:hypothetical protein
MNVFNRVFVIITLLVVMVVGAVTLVSPAFVLGLMRSAADTIRTTAFAGFTDVGRVITRIILALAWIGFIVLVIWAELRRPGSRTIEVARYTGGSAIRISTGAVADKVHEAVSAISGVIDAKVKATGRNRAVELRLDVSATKETDLVQKAEEIAVVTRQVVQDQLGLKLVGKPIVAIQAKHGKALKFQPIQRNVKPLDESQFLTPPSASHAPEVSITETTEPSPAQPTQSTQP